MERAGADGQGREKASGVHEGLLCSRWLRRIASSGGQAGAEAAGFNRGQARGQRRRARGSQRIARPARGTPWGRSPLGSLEASLAGARWPPCELLVVPPPSSARQSDINYCCILLRPTSRLTNSSRLPFHTPALCLAPSRNCKKHTFCSPRAGSCSLATLRTAGLCRLHRSPSSNGARAPFRKSSPVSPLHHPSGALPCSLDLPSVGFTSRATDEFPSVRASRSLRA